MCAQLALDRFIDSLLGYDLGKFVLTASNELKQCTPLILPISGLATTARSTSAVTSRAMNHGRVSPCVTYVFIIYPQQQPNGKPFR
jgi:hypothetical protein